MSPDGSKIATGTADKFARIWDSTTGKQLLALAHNDTLRHVVFSSDNNRLITAAGSCLSCDGTNWHVWDADTGREILKLENQARNFPVFSPGRQRVITAMKNSPIELRDTTTGATIATLKQTDESATVFSRDGTKILISSGRSKPQLWDALGGALLWELATEGSSIGRCCAFSPDGTRLILIVNKNVEILDVATGETMVTLGPRPDRPGLAVLVDATLSVDNKRAITIIEETVYLWDATTGASIVALKHDGHVSSATFSPDGSRLLTVSPGQVRLWDTAQGQEIISLRAHAEAEGRFAAGSVAGLLMKSAPVPIDVRPIPLAVVSPRGDRALISFDAASTQVLDSATGGQIARLDGTLRPSSGAAFTPDGRLVVTAATNGASNVWDVKTGNLVATLRDQEGDGGSAGIASFSSDGRSLMTDRYRAVQVWNLDPLVVALQDAANDLRSYRGRVNSVAFSPDGTKLATAAADKTGRVWDVRTGAALLTLRGHDAEVMSVAFAPDGKHLLTASLDKTARLWDATTGAALTVLESHDDGVNAASFSPDGKFIVTASADKTAKVWDATNGNVLLTFRGHDNTVMSAVFSPDGKSVLSASETLLIWDARTGSVLKKLLPLREAAGQSSTWSNVTDPKIAAAWNRDIKRWESVEYMAQVNTRGWHRSFAFYSPDGAQVVGAPSEWLVEVWNVETGLPIHILQNDAATLEAQFSPDARSIVTAHADGAAWLWRVKTSEPNSPLITKLAGHDGAVKAATFSPSGARLATAAADGMVRVWNISHCQTAIDRAHEILPREMSDNEAEKYFLSKKAGSTGTDIFAKARPWLAFALPAAGDACE
jgi:WD40 repeat protein